LLDVGELLKYRVRVISHSPRMVDRGKKHIPRIPECCNHYDPSLPDGSRKKVICIRVGLDNDWAIRLCDPFQYRQRLFCRRIHILVKSRQLPGRNGPPKGILAVDGVGVVKQLKTIMQEQSAP